MTHYITSLQKLRDTSYLFNTQNLQSFLETQKHLLDSTQIDLTTRHFQNSNLQYFDILNFITQNFTPKEIYDFHIFNNLKSVNFVSPPLFQGLKDSEIEEVSSLIFQNPQILQLATHQLINFTTKQLKHYGVSLIIPASIQISLTPHKKGTLINLSQNNIPIKISKYTASKISYILCESAEPFTSINSTLLIIKPYTIKLINDDTNSSTLITFKIKK